jgi:tRNA nucleotidyltransferase (CCA-adding enzyme)
MRDLNTKIKIYDFLDTKLKEQLSFISSHLHKYTNRAYIVGGSIRDCLNQSLIYDIDIEVYDIDVNTFDDIMQKIGAISVGKSFFVYKYQDIDIALARSERQISNHHRGFCVSIENDEKKACIRRDFKMNSIMLHLFTNEILDIYNGIQDIQDKRLSIINETRFKEDSLRVLRAIQFCARFNLRCEKNTLSIMKNIDISNISKNRIFIELQKLFISKHLHIGWHYIYVLDIFKKIFDINISYRQYINIYKIFKNTKFNYIDTNYKFYFLYIIFSIIKPNKKAFFDTNIFPNIYKKHLINQKYLPKNITNKFLISLSLKYPLKDFLGCYRNDIKQKAINLRVYQKSFIPKYTIQDSIQDGYKNQEIKQRFSYMSYKEIKTIV